MSYIYIFIINVLSNFNILISFQSQIDSSKFVSYICVQVLPHLSLINSPDGRDIQLELLKLLAELTVFCGTIEKPEDKVQQLYNTLIVSILFLCAYFDNPLYFHIMISIHISIKIIAYCLSLLLIFHFIYFRPICHFLQLQKLLMYQSYNLVMWNV